MRKPHRILRIALILTIFAMLIPVSACRQPSEQDTVDRLLSYIQNAEYPRIYQLLTASARRKITLPDLSARYSDVYRAIGLTSATCALSGVKAVDGQHKTAYFTLTATTEKIGQFKLDMEAKLALEGGKWLVDWTSELVLPDLEEGGRAVLQTDPASRGEIFDATGEALAENGHALSVYVDSSKVKNFETTIRLLAPQLGMTESDIREKLKGMMKKASAWTGADDTVPPEAAGISGATETPAATATPLPTPTATPAPTAAPGSANDEGTAIVVKAYPRDGLTWEQQQKLMEVPGVGIDTEWMTTIRYYPFGDLLSQTLGYTGVMTEADLAKPGNAGLARDAVVGRDGLESAWEQTLRGQPGYELYIEDAQGRRKTTLAKKVATDGHDLRLTIDMRLQQRAEMLLREYLTPQMAGSIIVMDPKTGYIEAMANAPGYDPNMFSFAINPADWKYLNDPVNMKPLINRATMALYPPGSTFKPFTASMGLTEGAINTNFVFPYEIKNNYWTPGEAFGIDKPIKRMEATPGRLNLQNAIIHSDNIFFAYTALKVGATKFYQHCLDLGLGLDSEHRMRFDLPLAASSITNSGKMDDARRLADSGYGQGQFQISPLQMAATFGSLANGGDIMQPRIVESVRHAEGPRYIVDKSNPPEVWREGVVPSYNLSLLVPALKKVASEGTAKALNRYSNLKDYKICAKTGTAEIGNDKTREIAWIIGFTTAKMDRLVCVSIEVPAGEGDIRTEIAKRMFDMPPPAKETETPTE